MLRSSVLEVAHHLDAILKLVERHVDGCVEADCNLAVIVRLNRLGVVDDALGDAVIVDDDIVDEHSGGLVQTVNSEHECSAGALLQDNAVLSVVCRKVELMRHGIHEVSDILGVGFLFFCDGLHS